MLIYNSVRTLKLQERSGEIPPIYIFFLFLSLFNEKFDEFLNSSGN